MGPQFRCSCGLQGTVNLIIAQNRLAKLAAAKQQGLAPASSTATADSDEINQMEEASRSGPSFPSCCQRNVRSANGVPRASYQTARKVLGPVAQRLEDLIDSVVKSCRGRDLTSGGMVRAGLHVPSSWRQC